MINCREQMLIKLEVLRILGMSQELRDMYCTDPPEQEATNINALKSISYRLNDYIGIQVRLYAHLTSNHGQCPYCCNSECHNCAYGEKYGLCLKMASSYERFKVKLKFFTPAINPYIHEAITYLKEQLNAITI